MDAKRGWAADSLAQLFRAIVLGGAAEAVDAPRFVLTKPSPGGPAMLSLEGRFDDRLVAASTGRVICSSSMLPTAIIMAIAERWSCKPRAAASRQCTTASDGGALGL